MTSRNAAGSDLLKLDCAKEADRIGTFMRDVVFRRFRRKGLVVGISGGIDSGVVAALAVRALGREHVLGLLMPERHSSEETLGLSRKMTEFLGIDSVHEDISPILAAFGCYRL